jgi:hypothetical protein
MLGLTLREEFQGRRLKGTAIELANENNTGATQVSAADFLGITYPTADVLAAIEAIGPGRGQPVVLIGERGQGKSHLLAVLYHGFTDPEVTAHWLRDWGLRLGQPKLGEIKLRPKTHVISESLHRQNFKFLWDLVFDRHPHGNYVRGKWEAQGEKRTDIPGDKLLIELFKHTPTALVLDEFQTWYDGLTNTKQFPWRTWAFNFIQLLSEIAKEYPELLVLVVSVRDGETEAYQQIHRVNPRQIDFKGPNARRDRLRLLLHRLFDNRMQVPEAQIAAAIAVHVSEHLRLADVAPAEEERIRKDFVEAWPFAPHLMTLLEDQVLVATQAQETRDLIRILADVFKSRGVAAPVITAADFRLDDDKSGIAALLDSVSNQHHANLREKAQRNLSAVLDAVKSPAQNVPHLADIVAALWLRSLAIKNAGAEPAALQVDITRSTPIDDNAFQAELSIIVENSFNIHQDGVRLFFREEENPQAKLKASARNDKLFGDGSDKLQLAREVRYAIGGTESVANKAFRVIVLAANWTTEPWEGVEEKDLPAQWDERIPLLIVPEPPDKIEAKLGTWLKDRLQTRRNAVRFLLSRDGSKSLFYDRDLLVLARAVLLAGRWKAQNPEFKKLHAQYERELRDILKRRFDRFAILATWNFQNPSQCKFHVESHKAQGEQIPETIDGLVAKNLFVSEDFEAFILAAAQQNESVGKLLRELQEPRPGGEDCIPWLGETVMKEKLIKVCARGEIAINLRGMEYMQVRAGEDEDTAWKRMRGRLGTGKHLDETYVLLPQAVPHAEGIVVPPVVVGPPGIAGGQLPLGGQAPVSGADESGTTTGNGQPPVLVGSGGGIFGGQSTVRQLSTAGATSALNLLGKVESWGITTGTQVQDVHLKVANLTGAQLNELLKKLPDGITYELSLNKEEK